MKFIKALFSIIILIAVVCVGGYFAIMHMGERTIEDKEPVNDVLDMERDTKHTTKVISDGFKDMGELVTYEYYYTQVENEESIKEIKGLRLPFTKSKYTISYEGTIDAGIDFSKIVVEEDESKGTIKITIPDAIITSNEVDTSSFEIYDEVNNIFNPIRISDVNTSIDNIKTKALENAKKKGIFDHANKNARILIENFVNSVVDPNEYKVVYE